MPTHENLEQNEGARLLCHKPGRYYARLCVGDKEKWVPLKPISFRSQMMGRWAVVGANTHATESDFRDFQISEFPCFYFVVTACPVNDRSFSRVFRDTGHPAP